MGRGKAPGRGTRYVVWWRYGTQGTQYGGIMVHKVHNMVALWYTGYNSMVDGGVRCGCPGSSSDGRWSGCLPAVLGALASLNIGH